MIEDNSRSVLTTVHWALVLALTFLLGAGGGFWLAGGFAGSVSLIGAPVINSAAGQPEAVDFSVLWETWSVIDDKYVNGTSSDQLSKKDIQDRIYGAAAGLVSSLGDPYTVFLPPEENEAFKEDIRGDFGGVGMELGLRDGELTVISALAGTPAKAAGIAAGDKLTRIDGLEASKLKIDEAVKKIRGDIGTKVKLSIFRPAEKKTYDFELTRARIVVPTLDAELRPSGVFVIKLHNFNANSVSLFRKSLRQFTEAKTDKLILDLRGNPGGYLDAAVEMASWFLPEGKVVVKEYHGGRGEDRVYRSKGYNVFKAGLKMVILVDKGSASASEILAGALSEYGKGVLMGEETFGKGSVQELVPLSDGSSVKVTIAKWLTPNDHSISDQGLKPTVEVKMTEADRQALRDPQLLRAEQYLLNWPKMGN